MNKNSTHNSHWHPPEEAESGGGGAVDSLEEDPRPRGHNRNETEVNPVVPVQKKPKRKSPVKPWKKEKDFPKRPLSAYNLFFRAERQRLLDASSSRKLGFATLAQTVAGQWKTLDDTARAPYDVIAAQEKERYDAAVAIWRVQKRAEKRQRQEEEQEVVVAQERAAAAAKDELRRKEAHNNAQEQRVTKTVTFALAHGGDLDTDDTEDDGVTEAAPVQHYPAWFPSSLLLDDDDDDDAFHKGLYYDARSAQLPPPPPLLETSHSRSNTWHDEHHGRSTSFDGATTAAWSTPAAVNDAVGRSLSTPEPPSFPTDGGVSWSSSSLRRELFPAPFQKAVLSSGGSGGDTGGPRSSYYYHIGYDNHDHDDRYLYKQHQHNNNYGHEEEFSNYDSYYYTPPCSRPLPPPLSRPYYCYYSYAPWVGGDDVAALSGWPQGTEDATHPTSTSSSTTTTTNDFRSSPWSDGPRRSLYSSSSSGQRRQQHDEMTAVGDYYDESSSSSFAAGRTGSDHDPQHPEEEEEERRFDPPARFLSWQQGTAETSRPTAAATWPGPSSSSSHPSEREDFSANDKLLEKKTKNRKSDKEEYDSSSSLVVLRCDEWGSSSPLPPTTNDDDDDTYHV